MRKRLIICSLMIVILLIAIGCSNKNKWDGYQHYSLNDKEPILYSYYDEYTNVYAVADITPENYEVGVLGIFYQIEKNDYILIDSIECNKNIDLIAKFYDDKLYVIGAVGNSGFYTYELHHENLKKEEVSFESRKKFTPIEIDKIEKGKIYLRAWTSDDEGKMAVVSANVECQLSNYKCEINDDNND